MSKPQSAKKVPTARYSKDGVTKVVKKPYRYGIVEMGSYHDVKVFEKNLRKRCVRKTNNVSPKSGRKITFSKKYGNKWPGYKKDIEDRNYFDSNKTEPEWWYVSGHHATMGDGQYYATEDAAGFFNEAYYDAYKKYIDKGKELPGKINKAVFMTTSELDSVGVKLSEQERSNPLFDKVEDDKCKGMFLIGCNTLTVPETRELYRSMYPQAAYFGYFFAKAPGAKSAQKKNIDAIFSSIKKTKPSFFEDPKRYFDENEGEENSFKNIVGKLSKKTRKRIIAVQYKSRIYIPEYYWSVKHWFHEHALNRFLQNSGSLGSSEKCKVCPVPGKKNPFTYEEGGKYINGSSSKSAKVSENFLFSEYGNVKGFKRVNAYLVMVIQWLRINLGSSVSIKNIKSKGDKVEFRCKFPSDEKKKKIFEDGEKKYLAKFNEVAGDLFSIEE